MVRINKDKLIIEINCNNPLATLVNFQTGLMTMIQIANLDCMSGTETVKEGVWHTSKLIKEMSVSFDQMERISDHLNDEEIQEFNRWSR